MPFFMAFDTSSLVEKASFHCLAPRLLHNNQQLTAQYSPGAYSQKPYYVSKTLSHTAFFLLLSGRRSQDYLTSQLPLDRIVFPSQQIALGDITRNWKIFCLI